MQQMCEGCGHRTAYKKIVDTLILLFVCFVAAFESYHGAQEAELTQRAINERKLKLQRTWVEQTIEAEIRDALQADRQATYRRIRGKCEVRKRETGERGSIFSVLGIDELSPIDQTE
jgi:predicted Holliday junction resolvase-like endonuclease